MSNRPEALPALKEYLAIMKRGADHAALQLAIREIERLQVYEAARIPITEQPVMQGVGQSVERPIGKSTPAPCTSTQQPVHYLEPIKGDVLYLDMGRFGWRLCGESEVEGYSPEYGQLEIIGGAIYNPGEWMIVLRNGKPFSLPERELSWVDASLVVPAADCEVFIATKHNRRIAGYYKREADQFFRWNNEGSKLLPIPAWKVAYWMVMPEPPEQSRRG